MAIQMKEVMQGFCGNKGAKLIGSICLSTFARMKTARKSI